MLKLLRTENLVKLLVAILLPVLTWDIRCIFNRISALERNQINMMVHLGIKPVAWENHTKWGAVEVLGASAMNQPNQKSASVP